MAYTPRRIRLTRQAEAMPAEPLDVVVQAPVVDVEAIARALHEHLARDQKRNGW